MEKVKPQMGPKAAPTLMAAIGRRVRERRLALGMMPVELAQAAGYTREGICHIEAGRATPSVVGVLGLCRALGMSPDELLGWGES
jgi:transcriptional regulator with XRE-family HTH domain